MPYKYLNQKGALFLSPMFLDVDSDLGFVTLWHAEAGHFIQDTATDHSFLFHIVTHNS